ncbi:MAG: 4-hydroxyphenylpyruvate dioxygenase [Gammaproteobacteria bacterium]|nr:4-hydroxyphenylpyruvate dioxygenase [Gammaproteobacteria bacterium]
MSVDENNPEPLNPLGIAGIEFIEYATSQPQALGHVLQKMGFMAVARHRSREVMLYRQGSLNIIVNAHPEPLPGMSAPAEVPVLKAIALRVRDAGAAWTRALALGAWEMPMRAQAMELNIPAIRGPGETLLCFVEALPGLTLYDVDFTLLPNATRDVPPLNDLHWFGIVQTVAADHSAAWIEFYQHLFAFTVVPGGQYFGVLPKGTLLESPCHSFYLQLIEPPPGADDVDWDEGFHRVGLGTRDVPAMTAELRQRGVTFIDRGSVQLSAKGALSQVYLGGVTFEIVHSHLQDPLGEL